MGVCSTFGMHRVYGSQRHGLFFIIYGYAALRCSHHTAAGVPAVLSTYLPQDAPTM